MGYDISTLLGASAAAIPAIGSIWVGYRHLRYSAQNKKDKERQAILEEAKQFDSTMREKLETKINSLETQVNALRDNVSRDFSSMKDSHTLELRNLSDKIEVLREELKDQSVGILNLLTKLVDK